MADKTLQSDKKIIISQRTSCFGLKEVSTNAIGIFEACHSKCDVSTNGKQVEKLKDQLFHMRPYEIHAHKVQHTSQGIICSICDVKLGMVFFF